MISGVWVMIPGAQGRLRLRNAGLATKSQEVRMIWVNFDGPLQFSDSKGFNAICEEGFGEK